MLFVHCVVAAQCGLGLVGEHHAVAARPGPRGQAVGADGADEDPIAIKREGVVPVVEAVRHERARCWRGRVPADAHTHSTGGARSGRAHVHTVSGDAVGVMVAGAQQQAVVAAVSAAPRRPRQAETKRKGGGGVRNGRALVVRDCAGCAEAVVIGEKEVTRAVVVVGKLDNVDFHRLALEPEGAEVVGAARGLDLCFVKALAKRRRGADDGRRAEVAGLITGAIACAATPARVRLPVIWCLRG